MNLNIIAKNNLIKWLNTKEKYCDTVHDKYNDEISKYCGNHSSDMYNFYYNNDNDMDVELSDNDLIDIILNDDDNKYNCLNDLIENYGDRHIYIKQGTNHAHAAYLYKELLNESAEMTLVLPNKQNKNKNNNNKGNELDEINIFNKNMKQAFYNFCMKHSA